jgi:hypothetical protein
MWSLPPPLPPTLPPSIQSHSPPLPEASPSWDADLSVEKAPKTPTQDHVAACAKAFVFSKPAVGIITPRTCVGSENESSVGFTTDEATMQSSGSDSEHEILSTCTTPLGSGCSGSVLPPPGLALAAGLPTKIGITGQEITERQEPVRPLCLSNLL